MAQVSPFDSARAKLAGAWRGQALSRKALTFALIGLVNTAVDYGIFLLARGALGRSPAALSLIGSIADRCHCGGSETVLLIAANSLAAGLAGEGHRHPGKFRRQFFIVALCRLPHAGRFCG
jgi:hypothetical protein